MYRYKNYKNCTLLFKILCCDFDPGVLRVWFVFGSHFLLARKTVVKIMSMLCDIEINSSPTDQFNFKIVYSAQTVEAIT